MATEGQKWPNCGEDVKRFVSHTIQIFQLHLEHSLEAVYLHGSLAMGCFYPPKSDIDILIAVSDPITNEEHRVIHEALLELNDQRPITGALELSVVTSATAKNPVHPAPYELHFGENLEESIRDKTFDYARKDSQVDPDLAAHFMVVKNRGVTLFGQSPEVLLGDPSWEDYMHAVLEDLDWILAEMNILDSPYYGVLNSCRVLQMLNMGEGTISSKEEGALWALKNLPGQYEQIILEALDCYRSPDPISSQDRRRGGRAWNEDRLLTYRDYVLREVREFPAISPTRM